MPASRAALVTSSARLSAERYWPADVHRYAQRRITALRERREIAARASQHPAAELHGEPGNFRDGQEFGCGHQAADLVRPTKESLDRDDLAGRERQARLVVKLELIFGDGLRELLLPVEARERGETQRVGVEGDGAVRALAAAGVERGERAVDELRGTHAVGARQRHARLRRELEDLSVEIHRVAQRLHHGRPSTGRRRRANGFP